MVFQTLPACLSFKFVFLMPQARLQVDNFSFSVFTYLQQHSLCQLLEIFHKRFRRQSSISSHHPLLQLQPTNSQAGGSRCLKQLPKSTAMKISTTSSCSLPSLCRSSGIKQNTPPFLFAQSIINLNITIVAGSESAHIVRTTPLDHEKLNCLKFVFLDDKFHV